jgi:hypothetical protein
VSTTLTFGSAAASVEYTIPSGASPRAMKFSAVRTLSAATMRFSTAAQAPRRVSASCP